MALATFVCTSVLIMVVAAFVIVQRPVHASMSSWLMVRETPQFAFGNDKAATTEAWTGRCTMTNYVGKNITSA